MGDTAGLFERMVNAVPRKTTKEELIAATCAALESMRARGVNIKMCQVDNALAIYINEQWMFTTGSLESICSYIFGVMDAVTSLSLPVSGDNPSMFSRNDM